MKTILIKSTSILFLSILLFSSCTVEKRRYSSGYHVDWHFNKRNTSHSINKNKEIGSVVQKTNQPQQINEVGITKTILTDSIPSTSNSTTKTQLNKNSRIISHQSQNYETKKISTLVKHNLKSCLPIQVTRTIRRTDSNEVPNIPLVGEQKEKNHAGSITLFVLGGISLLVGLMMWVGISGASGMGGALILGFLGLALGVLGVILIITALILLFSRKKVVANSKKPTLE